MTRKEKEKARKVKEEKEKAKKKARGKEKKKEEKDRSGLLWPTPNTDGQSSSIGSKEIITFAEGGQEAGMSLSD